MLAPALLFAAAVTQKAITGGVALELSVGSGQKAVREGEDVSVDLRVTDSATGAPLAGVRPALWMTRRSGNAKADAIPCAAKIARIASGSIFAAADVDLNIYYVIALNTDNTLTIVDPRFGYGGSHLLALVELSNPGEDWALTADESRLFVSIPKSNRVAVVDTAAWKVLREIDAGPNPTDVELQPDGKYVWVANDAGVAAIDTSSLAVTKIETGRGPHRLAATSDSGAVMVTNAGAGTVTIVDPGKLARRADVPAGTEPVAIAWSSRSELAYAAGADGVITIIEPKRARAVAKIETHPGIHDIRITRDGKWGFILNREKNLVQVLDAAAGRVVQAGVIAGTPEQVNFTDTIAYITQVRDDAVLMSTLANLGERGKPLSLADFTGGDHPPGAMPRTQLAGGVAAAAGENAVMVANPTDGEIYYYKEGMAAPMGHFPDYGHRPAAVLSLDRSMREAKPGTFRTQTRLPRGGTYDVEVYLDAPRAVSCFELTVETDQGRERERHFGRVAVEYLALPASLPAGRDSALRFRLHDARTNEERRGVGDVTAMVVQNPGGWRARQAAVPRDDGTYELTIHPPAPGVYLLYIESASLQMPLSNPNQISLDVR